MFSVPYTFYTDCYQGAMGEDEFGSYGSRAAVYVNYITAQRAVENAQLPAVKLAVCAVADVMKKHSTRSITEESNDGLSVHYAAEVQENRSRAMYLAAQQYLSGTGLLYLGVYDDAGL